MKKDQIIGYIKDAPAYVKAHWKTPAKGEYLSLSEMLAYMFTQAGSYVFATFAGIMTFSATYFTGSIMEIENIDFAKISIIGTIVSFALIFLNPIGTLIYENHGKLNKKMKIFAIVSYSGQIVLGIACYFVPATSFEFIIKGMPQIIGNTLLVGGISNFYNWGVRRLFSEKHGRMKPFIIATGIPAAIIISVIPFLPVQNLSYTNKLIVLNFAFSLMNYFYQSYVNVNGIVTFLTPNSQERQKLFSIVPIVSGFFSSMISLFLPMLIATTGGYLNLKTYKVFVPIFSFAGAFMSLAVIKCKERVIEQTGEKRKEVTFFKGAKQVLQNKYFWIINISTVLGQWQWLIGSVLSWWFIYSLRMEWFSGVAANIVVIGMTVGNILCPILTKKFEKRTILIVSRFSTMLLVMSMILAIRMENIVIFIIAMILKNTIQPVVDGVGQGINADVQHYHQWKYGERADAISGIFSWFLNPVIALMGYIMPYILKLIGFTSDWDVLYDSVILNRVFTVYTWGTVVSVFLLTIPYFFYDLSKEKYDICIRELKERAGVQEENEQEETDEPVEEAEETTADGSVEASVEEGAKA